MIKYAKQILNDSSEITTSISASHAVDHLFDIRDESEAKLLPEEQAQHFHHSVAQLQFLCIHT